MKMHSDKLTADDLYVAAHRARTVHRQDIHVIDALDCGSRSRAHGVEFHCGSNHGRYARASGRGPDVGGRAASWDAWGWLIGELFRLDPDAIIGNYKGVTHFIETCERAHEERQQWTAAPGGRRAVAGTYGVDISFLAIVRPLIAVDS